LTRPLIGITTYRSLSRYSYPVISLTEAYVQALSLAGADPLLVPPGLPDKGMGSLLARLDGILFSGGGDIHPRFYGSQPHPLVTEVDEDRDRVEIALVRQAMQRGTPFLGICRGLQVINVALGGSLYEDLLDQYPNSLKHDSFPEKARDYLAHSVSIDENSQLAEILGTQEVQVNSLHHQGIRKAAPDLRSTAHAPDGVIEAVEAPEHPFGLAVQWHPEWLQAHLVMRSLFERFVQAAA
jgi:putative glutamine amidotransferase